jgi:serine/threonine-protein kinase
MGTVYRVWDLKRNVHLAMKVLHADLADDPSVFKLFQREARALKKLAHPNIVPFYGLNKTSDFPFLLELFVDGATLKWILRRLEGRAMAAQDTLAYLKALSSALGYAHAHGVVHSDVKPGNVMVDRGGAIYLTDFGVARHADSTATTLGVAGTAAYMAPEQCRGEAVNSQTDVYALGVLLFEMLTGRRPFRGDESGSEGVSTSTAERIRYAHQKLRPPDPRSLNPEIYQALAGVILKALAKNPSERFQSAREMFEAACAAVGVAPEDVPDRLRLPQELLAALAPASAAIPAAAAPPPVAPPGEMEIPPRITGRRAVAPPAAPARRRGKLVGILAAFAGLAVVGAVLLIVLRPWESGSVGLPAIQPEEPQGVVVRPTNTRAPTVVDPISSSPTNTPRPTNTPEPEPGMYGFLACEDECRSDGSNATRTFPGKIRKIYLRWDYENVPVGSEYMRIWEMPDMGEWARYECDWPGPENGVFEITLTDPQGLRSGEWIVTVLVDGRMLLQESLWIEGNYYEHWNPAGYFTACTGKR